VVLVLEVCDEVDHALYADVGAAHGARLNVARGDLPAWSPRSPRPHWRSPADPHHAR